MELNGNCELFTLDEILVSTDLSMTTCFCSTGEAIQGYLNPDYLKFANDRGVIFFEYKITDF